MHEALLSRGKVQGSEYENFIMSRYNCLFPCIFCHQKMIGIGGDEGFRLAALHLVKREGYAEVREWLLEAKNIFKTAGTEALNRFDAIFTQPSKLEK